MKRTLNHMFLTTDKTSISVQRDNGHMYVILWNSDLGNVRSITSVKDSLTQFESKAFLIHIYKTMERIKAMPIDQTNQKLLLKKALDCCNYAEVFGSRWN